ncbi:MAG: methyltransferase domain-containing protein [Desulfobacter sp.]|nr:MAG: methyltransferase domain-containing protein [Desulfobacter sp.]
MEVMEEIEKISGICMGRAQDSASQLVKDIWQLKKVRELALPDDMFIHPIKAAEALGGQGRGGNIRDIALFLSSEKKDRGSIFSLLASLQYILADQAVIVIDHADLPAVYQGLLDVLLSCPGYRLQRIVLDPSPHARPGQGAAILDFCHDRAAPQEFDTIPKAGNRQLGHNFIPTMDAGGLDDCLRLVRDAVNRFLLPDAETAKKAYETINNEFPDQFSPSDYWHNAYGNGFVQFFCWGHNQDFGHGYSRQGAMDDRHLEVLAECLQQQFLPKSLEGLTVLDVGCWTGGDALGLAGLGATVTALEEHPVSARAASRLFEVVQASIDLSRQSLYSDNENWQGTFDIVYLSGVIYHVTDPLLALRICFAYLKPGGRLIIETKSSGIEGAFCEYGGTLEKGWNWFSPTVETLGRWLADAGFDRTDISIFKRPVGRLLAMAVKRRESCLKDDSGFSRPGTWLCRSI